MNRIILILSFVALLLPPSLLVAQTDGMDVAACRRIVAAKYADKSVLDELPVEKLLWHCAFSHNSFYESDTIASGAPVYPISDVRSTEGGEALPADFVVDLATLSYYAYDFHRFRYDHYESEVYFSTPASGHRYLVMRTYVSALTLTNEQTGQ